MSKYYLFDGEDFIWFFKNENGKLKYFASWTIASLGLVDWEAHIEKVKEEEKKGNLHHEYYINYTLEKDKWLKSLTIEDVKPVSKKLTEYLEKIQSNGIGHIFLTGTLENPTEDENYEYEDE